MLKSTIMWKEVSLIFIVSRLVILIVTWLTMSSTLTISSSHLPQVVVMYNNIHDVHAYFYAWWRWDAVHFINIASRGYDPGLTVFFPLWPLFISGLSHLLESVGWGNTAYYVAGIILANLCFYFALVLLYCLTEKQFSPRAARTTLLFLTFSPYALFFFAGYTESLFLLLSLATFFFLYHKGSWGWWLAGFCAALATITRETGCILIVPFLVLLVQRFWPVRTELYIHWRSLLHALLPLFLIPLGILIYMFYLNKTWGNPLLFSSEELTHWHRHLILPGLGLLSLLWSLLTSFSLSINTWFNSTDISFSLLPMIVLIIGWKHLPLHYSFFALAMIVFSISTIVVYSPKPLMSYPRYMLVIFPIFMLFPLWSKKPLVMRIILGVFFILFTYNIVQFVTNRWVA